MALDENIIPISIEEEMKNAYIDYSMSVIISRALPDVRDGFKPVHRRVLYGMMDLGLNHNKPYKKSARIVGEVLGKYHPHGDSSVYMTMVRMAQNWSLRYPLVDGQGNFGSIDGDNPAAMRYTEARLRKIAEEMLTDIQKNTVDYQPNFDESLKEPTVLPAKIPNLLVNGASGIAVGMATNMMPHNLSEVIGGTIAYINNNDITVLELMEHIKAPDFPTGATIYGMQGVRKAFETGRGRVVMRAVSRFETTKTGKNQIIISELPYQINKAAMIEKIAGLINEKKIEGISAIRDESDKDGIRVVFDLKRDAIPDIVLNTLYRYTPLQSSQGINNIALVKGRPVVLNLKDQIKYFVEHRHEIVVRRTQHDLKKAEDKAHILEGYLKALDNLDAIIDLIRASRTPDVAKAGLIEQFEFSERQAKAILEMRLQRLTGMERDKIQQDYDATIELIKRFKEILGSEEIRMNIIKDELLEINEKYGDERRTQIVHSYDEIGIEDMIPDEEMVITISNQGYMKRTKLTEYKAQGRGGVGSRGATSKQDDFTEHLFVATMHNYLLIFTKLGKVFWQKVYSIPEGGKATKGRPLQNLIQIAADDKVQAVINVTQLNDADFVNNHYLIMCTEQGMVKKTSLEKYSRPRQNGINAITIKEGDTLLNVKLTDGTNDIVMAARSGRAIRFNETKVRSMGRTASGVKGITLRDDNDKVVGLVCIHRESPDLLVVSEKGYGKRSALEDYRVTNRGGKGVMTLKVTEKTGELVAMHSVMDGDDLMIINKSGITIRMHVSALRTMGRATQGVRLIKLSESDEISSVAKIEDIDHDEEEENIENTEEQTENNSEETNSNEENDSPEE